MIYSLKGKVIFTDTRTVVIECGGVGFACRATLNTISRMPKKGEEAFLYTHLVVREDAMELYGFAAQEELTAFKLLTSVNGVGPKVGISILSEFTPDRLAFLISAGDAKSLTGASGVGGKTAQRIVLELKDKMGIDIAGGEASGGASAPAASSNTADAAAALVAIGYTSSEAASAIGKLDPTLPADTLIKQALKKLM